MNRKETSSLFQNQAESIFISLSNRMIDEMLEECTKWARKETGGMMFGTITKVESRLEIKIEKTQIPSDEYCVRNSSYFEINPEYARFMLDNEKLLYLGNWHKHLGYGGPSYGDHKQIEEFFKLNPHKNLVLSMIFDAFSDEDHELIVEVYQRNKTLEEEEQSIFRTYRIPKSNISFFSGDDDLPKKETGITEGQISMIKHELTQVFNSQFTIKDIHQFIGSSFDEKILSFPFRVDIETQGSNRILDLLILISFPPNFPDGQIYIDISSQDLSRKFTIEKHPANVLYEEELIQPFLLLLKDNLEETVPEIMKKPLWKVMSGLK